MVQSAKQVSGYDRATQNQSKESHGIVIRKGRKFQKHVLSNRHQPRETCVVKIAWPWVTKLPNDAWLRKSECPIKRGVTFSRRRLVMENFHAPSSMHVIANSVYQAYFLQQHRVGRIFSNSCVHGCLRSFSPQKGPKDHSPGYENRSKWKYNSDQRKPSVLLTLLQEWLTAAKLQRLVGCRKISVV